MRVPTRFDTASYLPTATSTARRSGLGRVSTYRGVVAGPLLTSIDANRSAPGRTKYRPHLDVTTRSIRRLSAPAREVVLFEPTPLAAASADPLSCLSAGTAPSRCEYNANRAPTPFERFLRATANHSDVWAVDVDRLACPRLPVCDPVVNNVIVKRDWSHLTATYSRTLAGPLFAILHRQHLL